LVLDAHRSLITAVKDDDRNPLPQDRQDSWKYARTLVMVSRFEAKG
jgi:hypothetical protein